MDDKTKIFSTLKESEVKMEKELQLVYTALCEKGYSPITQLAGYILTEDPTYITSYNEARKIASRMDRYEILELLLKKYFEHE